MKIATRNNLARKLGACAGNFIVIQKDKRIVGRTVQFDLEDATRFYKGVPRRPMYLRNTPKTVSILYTSDSGPLCSSDRAAVQRASRCSALCIWPG